MEGAAPSRRGGMKSRISRSFSGLLGGYPGMSEGARAILGEAEDEEGEESEETEVATALAGVLEASEAENLAHSNQPLVSQAEPNFLKMMENMTQFLGQLTQEVAPRENSKAPAFKTPSMKAPDSFDGTQAHEFRGFIQYCQFIFHNDPANFCNQLLFSLVGLENVFNPTSPISLMKILPISSVIGRYLKPNYSLCLVIPMKSGKLNKSWILRMKEGGHVSLYIAELRSLMSRIRDWGERDSIHVYKRGLASRPLDQLASYPGNFDTLEEPMDITLELDTRYH
ncbi:hypothetical protein O181_035184 [Austropuccinia psidii MF-1]|uniref:Uncharacterized protein n=1 Tax=Austropuccinia psidii MF-1 TaxID=1389203 RepID=A0A9Q3D263_9BASI|nr:hypothetical protein [Austropuccinia psidii MF-1]